MASAQTEYNIATGTAKSSLSNSLIGAESGYDSTMQTANDTESTRSASMGSDWMNSLTDAATGFLTGEMGAEDSLESAAAGAWNSFVGALSGDWTSLIGDASGNDPTLVQQAQNESSWTTSVTSALSATSALSSVTNGYVSTVMSLTTSRDQAYSNAGTGWYSAAMSAWDTLSSGVTSALVSWWTGGSTITETFNNTLTRLQTAYTNAVRGADAAYAAEQEKVTAQSRIQAEADKVNAQVASLQAKLQDIQDHPESYHQTPSDPAQQRSMLAMMTGNSDPQETFASKSTELRDRLASIKLQLDAVDRSEHPRYAVPCIEH